MKTPGTNVADALAIAADTCAMDLLQQSYRRDVAALAEQLKPALVAGRFSGYQGELSESGAWYPEANHGFEALEAICARHRRVSSPDLFRITLAVCPERTIYLLDKCGSDKNHEVMVAFCLAYDVRRYAILHWRAPGDDWFGLSEKEWDAEHPEPKPAQRTGKASRTGKRARRAA